MNSKTRSNGSPPRAPSPPPFSIPSGRDAYGYAAELWELNQRYRAALARVNEIRDNIIRSQTVGFSRDVYPLVATLDWAGFPSKITRSEVALIGKPGGPKPLGLTPLPSGRPA